MILWCLLGFLVVATIVAAAIIATDGRDALAERTAAFPILLTGLALAPVWPMFATMAAASWAIEYVRRRRAPSSKRADYQAYYKR
jgi:hypothetical protein